MYIYVYQSNKFVATFFPLLFLLRKCWSMSRRSRTAMRKYYGNEFYIKNKEKLEIEMVKRYNISMKTDDVLDTLQALTIQYTKNWILTKTKCVPLPLKRFFVVLIANDDGNINKTIDVIHHDKREYI